MDSARRKTGTGAAAGSRGVLRRFLAGKGAWRAPTAILAFAVLSHAAPNIDVTARVDRTEITVGDVVHYEITVAHPAAGRVDLPAVRGNVGRFEVQDYRVVPGKAADGRVTATHALTLSTFTLGDDTLPPQRVEYRAGTDTAVLVLYTPATFVRVNRVSPANAKDIADITGPERLPGNVPWGLLGLLALALAFWAYRAWRKKHPREKKVGPRAPLPPYEEALEKLRTLEAAGLPAQGLGREFAFALSEILRGYIGRRYEVDALEATSEELLERAAALPLTAAQQEWLRAFTGELDTVKFATGLLDEADAVRRIEAAREFFYDTRPVPETVNPETSGAAGTP